MKKYKQCELCCYNDDKETKDICERCVNTDPEYNLEPPTEWKYEDPEGEWK